MSVCPEDLENGVSKRSRTIQRNWGRLKVQFFSLDLKGSVYVSEF